MSASYFAVKRVRSDRMNGTKLLLCATDGLEDLDADVVVIAVNGGRQSNTMRSYWRGQFWIITKHTPADLLRAQCARIRVRPLEPEVGQLRNAGLRHP